MNPITFIRRRPIRSFVLLVVLAAGTVLGLTRMGVKIFPPPTARKINANLDMVGRKAMKLKVYVVAHVGTYFKKPETRAHHEEHEIVVSTPKARSVTLTQPYVCQIHSQNHIEVKALENGYLQEIRVKEGQAVKKGELLFKVIPVLYQARLNAKVAEVQLAQLEVNNTKRLFDQKVVSEQAVKLLEAKLARVKAEAELAMAEFNFTNVTAQFDGIIDRLYKQQGSLVEEGDTLTTLSDNSLMWVYFNVPESLYLEYMDSLNENKQDTRIELVLANGKTFPQVGKINAIEAKFNNMTGTVPFRADFPNPNRLLRHGQTGTVMIRRRLDDAVVIPQRAAFEVLDKRYVYLVDKDDVAHQREISIENTLDDIYLIKKGLTVDDRIILEGTRQVHDGQKVQNYAFSAPEVVMAKLKNHAE